MNCLMIIFLLLAVPAAIQCKPAVEERQVDASTINTLIQSLFTTLTGPGGALNGKGMDSQVQTLLTNLLGSNNGSLTSLAGNPGLGSLDLVRTLQNVLNGLLKQNGVVQQLLTALGGDPDALKQVLVLLFGPKGVVQALLGPNGILGQLLSVKPLNLQGLVQNLLQTLLPQTGLLPRANALGTLENMLVAEGGQVTNLLMSLFGASGTKPANSNTSNNSNNLGLLGGLVNALLGVVTNLLQVLGLIPTGTLGGGGMNGNSTNGNSLVGLLTQLLAGYPSLLNQILTLLNGTNGMNGNLTPEQQANWANVLNSIKQQLAGNPSLLNLVLTLLGNSPNGNSTNAISPNANPTLSNLVTSLLDNLLKK